jgi:uncharacterized protein (DUF4415 family)
MSTKLKKSEAAFVDPDDAPPWTEDQLDRAEFAIGGKVVREAQGTLTKRGRPKLASPKQQISIRFDADVIDAFKRRGPKWQAEMNTILRKAAGLK